MALPLVECLDYLLAYVKALRLVFWRVHCLADSTESHLELLMDLTMEQDSVTQRESCWDTLMEKKLDPCFHLVQNSEAKTGLLI